MKLTLTFITIDEAVNFINRNKEFFADTASLIEAKTGGTEPDSDYFYIELTMDIGSFTMGRKYAVVSVIGYDPDGKLSWRDDILSPAHEAFPLFAVECGTTSANSVMPSRLWKQAEDTDCESNLAVAQTFLELLLNQ